MPSKKPGFYLQIKETYPELLDAVEQLGHAAREAGPLDEKTLHLVQLAAAAAVRSEGAVHSHTRRALSAGATREEICHALIAVTSTIGFPNVTAALSWSNDVFESHKSNNKPAARKSKRY
jgi:4-carboxymuconolactone decarboxylase